LRVRRQRLRERLHAFKQAVHGTIGFGGCTGQAAIEHGATHGRENVATGGCELPGVQAWLDPCGRAARHTQNNGRSKTELEKISALHGLTIARATDRALELDA
jgi:hypothetical protein